MLGTIPVKNENNASRLLKTPCISEADKIALLKWRSDGDARDRRSTKESVQLTSNRITRADVRPHTSGSDSTFFISRPTLW